MKNYNVYVLSGNEETQKLLLQINVPFVDLIRHAAFTSMKDPSDEPFDDIELQEQNKFYQRQTDEKRIQEMKKFVKDTIVREFRGESVATLFPTAILISTQMDDSSFQLHDTCTITESQLFMNDLYIVDGQHRLEALRQIYEEKGMSLFMSDEDKAVISYVENYVFNCTLLLNFDLWEQAQVFADVNFKQKKVDKSLYYAIYGMKYSEHPADYNRNYIYIAHNLVRYMNTSSVSPLFGMIKMLGAKQSTNKGIVSQACLAEVLMRNIKSRQGIWYIDPEGLETKPKYGYMAAELVVFYTLIKKLMKNVWPSVGESNGILMKTTGVGAMIALMSYIHRYKISETLKLQLKTARPGDELTAYNNEVEPLITKLAKYQEILFGKDSKFAGSGGKGLVRNLTDRMISIINDSLVGEDKESLIEQDVIKVNNIELGVKYYDTHDGFFRFELSHHFKNPDQIDFYRPGSGSMAKDMEHLRYKFDLYVQQIAKDAEYIVNPNY